MPAYFEQGFFVRVPAWHGLGIVLDEYPGREEAMKLAGHDWDVIEGGIRGEFTNDMLAGAGLPINQDGNGKLHKLDGWKMHVRSDTGGVLHVSRETYERIPNSVAYDFAELLLDEGFLYETGITLKDGALCALTLKLNEPIVISGDTSETLPYLGLSWAHDGSASLRGRSTSVRQVCANTVAASEAEGARLGTDFSIRHTKNWKARVEDAKKAMKGTRRDIETYREVMETYAAMPVTHTQRELFVQAVVLDQKLASVARFKSDAAAGNYSPRVLTNVDNATTKLRELFKGDTIPEAHRFTAYGLHLAAVEYLDHIRTARSKDSHVGRTLLRDEPAKARLTSLIRDVVAA